MSSENTKIATFYKNQELYILDRWWQSLSKLRNMSWNCDSITLQQKDLFEATKAMEYFKDILQKTFAIQIWNRYNIFTILMNIQDVLISIRRFSSKHELVIVIKSIGQLFIPACLFTFIHIKGYHLHSISWNAVSHQHRRGVATSTSTPCQLAGNAQVERCNGIIWKTVLLDLKSNLIVYQFHIGNQFYPTPYAG